MKTSQAFVPGHVTGFFTVEEGEDPTATGSTGAGLTLTDGVAVEVAPSERNWVQLNGDTVEMAAVEGVLEALQVTAAVRAKTDLPVGAGFGVSGAMALGTALAANDLFGTGLSENELVAIAHGAEVQAGTGLGDVVAQARGGAPIRLEPGDSYAGKLDGIPARARVEYVTFGELSTAGTLSNDTDALQQPGEEALSRVVQEPTLEQFMFASRRFARETSLLEPAVARAIEDVIDAGGEASMAMLGETVFALESGLSAADYDPAACNIDVAGARLLD